LKISRPTRDYEVHFESKSGASDTVCIGNPDFHSCDCEDSIIGMVVSFRQTKTSRERRLTKIREVLTFKGFLVLRVSLPSLYFKIVKAWDLFQKNKEEIKLLCSS
jgi:hypothetical protein